jgi:hypothetical protein
MADSDKEKQAATKKPAFSDKDKQASKAGLSEKDKNTLLAALAIVALAAAAYVIFLSEPSDAPSDGFEFVDYLAKAESAAFLYDTRGADEKQATAIYQCGVDLISKGIVAGKNLVNIGCDSSGCLSTTSTANGSSTLTYEQAKKKVSSMPYILIKPAQESGFSFYQRHMEIYIGKNITNSSSCSIKVSAG